MKSLDRLERLSPKIKPQPEGLVPRVDLVATRVPQGKVINFEYGAFLNPKISKLVRIITGRVFETRRYNFSARFIRGDKVGLEWRVKNNKISKSDEWAKQHHVIISKIKGNERVNENGQLLSPGAQLGNEIKAERFEYLNSNSGLKDGDIDEWIDYLEYQSAYLTTVKQGVGIIGWDLTS